MDAILTLHPFIHAICIRISNCQIESNRTGFGRNFFVRHVLYFQQTTPPACYLHYSRNFTPLYVGDGCPTLARFPTACGLHSAVLTDTRPRHTGSMSVSERTHIGSCRSRIMRASVCFTTQNLWRIGKAAQLRACSSAVGDLCTTLSGWT